MYDGTPRYGWSRAPSFASSIAAGAAVAASSSASTPAKSSHDNESYIAPSVMAMRIE